MFEFDRYGFPTIHIQPANVHVHLLPVTRSQFEFYLADHPSPGMDMQWYDLRLRDHPRVDPGSVDERNYAGLFTTGVLPSEAQLVADMFGAQYSSTGVVTLPDLDTWQSIFRHAIATPAVDLSLVRANARLSPFAKRILEKLAPVVDRFRRGSDTPTLADQMFLRHGVNEIVERVRGGSNYCVIGYPASRFNALVAANPDEPKPVSINPHIPSASHGFRFVWRTV
jgi:hypothetical protein